MKKIFAIILAVLMLIAIAVPALADDYDFNSAEFYANDNECPHKAGGTYTDSYRYDEFNDTMHCKVTVRTYICKYTYCRKTYQEDVRSDNLAHDIRLRHATCNGSVQTRYSICTLCTYTRTETVDCPGANHSGNCHWLPI